MANIAPLGAQGKISNCTFPAIDDFPPGLFTKEQRENGAIVVHVIVSLYLFAALAVVCDKYFVPAVDRICKALNMSNDVAGATFMAAATSAPELFVNVIGTFITEGDIGLGTIVGSAVFNILAVAACCGLSAKMVVPLDWWPLTRDCFAYGVTVIILISIIHDERVEWYEALVLVILYAIYICFMYFDKSIQKCVRGTVDEISGDHQMQNGDLKNETPIAKIESDGDILPEKPKVEKKIEIPNENEVTQTEKNANIVSNEIKGDSVDTPEDEYRHSLWRYPFKQDCFTQVTWVVTWPINLVFMFTIPDCENPRFWRWYPLTFIMCIVWIGSLSYAVAWMITIIGDTLRIPDSVMGITFLAAGTSVPEAVSSVIVAKQGHGSMGISNSIGSNTFDILLCLGLPWFIKASFRPTNADEHVVSIISAGLVYSAISLLSTLFLLYLTFWCNNFKLDKKVGYICLCMYAVFLVLATLIELNVFFQVNLPMCNR